MTAIIRHLISNRAPLLLCAVALVLPACETDGHFSFCGYCTVPNYDPNIRTVYVPIFKNTTLRRGVEFDLTEAVIRAIEQKTPFKVVHHCEGADTELLGTIVSFNKAILNRNQENEIREGEMTLLVEVVWRDRRTGDILSGPGRRLTDAPPPMPVPKMTAEPIALGGGDAAPIDVAPQALPGAPKPPPPALASSYATFIPELGESITTAEQKNVNRLATQIVSMMESPW